MGIRRVEQAGAEIAGQADAVDHVPGGPPGCQEIWQVRPPDRLHGVLPNAQMLGQSPTDGAGGAKDGEKLVFHERISLAGLDRQ